MRREGGQWRRRELTCVVLPLSATPGGLTRSASSVSAIGAAGIGSGDVEAADGRKAKGIFQDEQDVPMPTLSIYDPERLWEHVERPMMVYMPLKKLSAKVGGAERRARSRLTRGAG